jgi:hypothetical protein
MDIFLVNLRKANDLLVADKFMSINLSVDYKIYKYYSYTRLYLLHLTTIID